MSGEERTEEDKEERTKRRVGGEWGKGWNGETFVTEFSFCFDYFVWIS
jgi:hypothetical protein